jgi:hypothetical protein
MTKELEQHENEVHLEIERGFPLKAKEYAHLLILLAKLNFKATTTSVINDTLLPTTKKRTTHRIRREQVLMEHLKRVNEVIFYLTHKAHPKMKNGKHVRHERERHLTAVNADQRIAQAISKLWDSIPLDAVKHTLPSYSKIRRSYTGELKIGKTRYNATVALDIAQGLGKYSGHYVEIEILLPKETKDKKVIKVEKGILKFAHKMLGDKRPPKRSYRKLLLKSLGLKEF